MPRARRQGRRWDSGTVLWCFGWSSQRGSRAAVSLRVLAPARCSGVPAAPAAPCAPGHPRAGEAPATASAWVAEGSLLSPCLIPPPKLRGSRAQSTGISMLAIWGEGCSFFHVAPCFEELFPRLVNAGGLEAPLKEIPGFCGCFLAELEGL